MNRRNDIPSYPQLGKILPGDYYADLPFDEYINRNQPVPSGGNVFDIRDFGAVADDKLNTEAFRKAAEACRDAGGGTILVTGGEYRMGGVRLYSNTTLFITPDSAIVASRNVDDIISSFNAEGKQRNDEESSGGSFVYAKGEENIVITGGGRISGSGEWYVYEPRKAPAMEPFDTTMLPTREEIRQNLINVVPGSVRTFYRDRIRYAEDKYSEGKPVLRRPSFMVWIVESRNVRLENVILHNAMCWTLHVDGCDDVVIRDLVIDDNRHVANTDGIDLSGCRRALVEHCFVSCADDGLCLKNPVHTGRSMEDIVIRDCTVLSVMNAFKIGTGTRHDIKNVLVEDCRFIMPDIYPGTVSGIAVESCDGSHVSNVVVRNIGMDNVVCPVYILLNQRNETGEPYTDEVGGSAWWGGSISGITIENVKATNVELPSIVTGFMTRRPDGTPVRRAVSDITLRNMEILYRDNKEVIRLPEEFDEFLVEYPECNAHGDVDACGFWVRHADRVTLDNINVTPRSCNTRKKIKLWDVAL